MKKLILGMVAAVMLAVCFVGCNDDNDEGVDNYFKINSEKHELSHGVITHYGEVDDVERFGILLLSSGLKIRRADNTMSISGLGDGFVLYLNSTKGKTDISNRVYYCEEEKREEFTFFGSSYVIDYNPITDDDANEKAIVRGGVSVDKYDDSYEIVIDVTDEDGKNVRGYYKGELIETEGVW